MKIKIFNATEWSDEDKEATEKQKAEGKIGYRHVYKIPQQALEDKINRWIEDNNMISEDIIDIKFSTNVAIMDNEPITEYVAMIIYK